MKIGGDIANDWKKREGMMKREGRIVGKISEMGKKGGTRGRKLGVRGKIMVNGRGEVKRGEGGEENWRVNSRRHKGSNIIHHNIMMRE